MIKSLVILIFLVGGITGIFVYRQNANMRLPKDDNYFHNKYGQDINNHDACVSEYEEKGQIENGSLGIPCPGEAQ